MLGAVGSRTTRFRATRDVTSILELIFATLLYRRDFRPSINLVLPGQMSHRDRRLEVGSSARQQSPKPGPLDRDVGSHLFSAPAGFGRISSVFPFRLVNSESMCTRLIRATPFYIAVSILIGAAIICLHIGMAAGLRVGTFSPSWITWHGHNGRHCPLLFLGRPVYRRGEGKLRTS